MSARNYRVYALFVDVQTAIADKCSVVLIDTASRLATAEGYLANLRTINTAMQELVPAAPHELLIVLDAEQGLDGLLQARLVASEVGLTGVIFTKVDRSAKCGFVFAVADDLAAPIKFLGTGEEIEDLVPFKPKDFVTALF